jgi:hypothetical protein
LSRRQLQERGVHRDDLSATGYWKRKRTDEMARGESATGSPRPKPT